jgi:hypothetical protein
MSIIGYFFGGLFFFFLAEVDGLKVGHQPKNPPKNKNKFILEK